VIRSKKVKRKGRRASTTNICNEDSHWSGAEENGGTRKLDSTITREGEKIVVAVLHGSTN